MPTFGVGVVPDEPSAMVTAAELPELTAATATLRPLASTAELASATIRRVRTTFMASNPSGAPPAPESGNHALLGGCRQRHFNGYKRERSTERSAVSAGSGDIQPSQRHSVSDKLDLISVRILQICSIMLRPAGERMLVAEHQFPAVQLRLAG
jgi:hypothetical protein